MHDKYYFYHFADSIDYQRILSLLYFTRARIKGYEGQQEEALQFLKKAYQYYHTMVFLHDTSSIKLERSIWKEFLVDIENPFQEKELEKYPELRSILPRFTKTQD